MHVAKAKLVHIIHRGTETFTAEYEIDEEPIIAGWHKDRQIYIRDPSVSPFHFKIFFHNQHWWIEDLNSPKGTRLNGINTAIQRLCHMDIIGAGASELQFQIVSNSSSITLAPDLCKKQSQIDYTSNHRLAVPLRASLRIVLDNLLKTDSDFDAFCLDYFPQVKNRLTNGMDRVAKMNLLIDKTDQSIGTHIKEHFK
mgnify:CR=1 FL=1